jgi:DMSO/TMAO reductase YedYZ molybdopterin-dependent catalytic subunit
VIELGARVVAGVATLPELVQDRLVQALPGAAFSFVLDRLLYLGKPLFFSGLLALQLLIAGLVGVALARWNRPVVILTVLWLAVGLVLLPLTGRPPFGSLAVAIATLASFAGYGLTLEALWATSLPPLPTSVTGVPADDTAQVRAFPAPLARRELLTGTVLLLAAAALARRAIGPLLSPPPRPAIAGGAASDPGTVGTSGTPPAVDTAGGAVTSPKDFYLVSKNLLDPELNATSWRLQVNGLVDHPLTLRYADVLALPAQDFYQTLECISNEVGGPLMSNGRWTGVRLSEVLQRAGVQAPARQLHFTCADGYTENMPLEQAMLPTTFLVYKLGGQPLPAKHGYPLRVLTAGTYGMKNPKWLMRIEAVAAGAVGFWEQQGWNPDAPVQTMSRIDTPAAGSVAAGSVAVGGVAFAGDRGIQRVELSLDGGQTWQATDLLPPLSPLTWVFWRTAATLQPGTTDLVVRATDGTGRLQTDQQTDTFPSGASGYHRIRLQVRG